MHASLNTPSKMPHGAPRFRSQNGLQRTIQWRGRRRDRWLGATAVWLGVAAVPALSRPAVAGPAPRGPDPEARVLVVVLDAVPFESARRFTRPAEGERPLLPTLEGPVPLVSSFPSSTSVALTSILSPFGLELPPGYENKFYDHLADRVRGGTLGSYGKIRFDWHHFFDWQLRGFFSKSKAYAKPLKYNEREIRKALQAFEASDQRAFFVYVNSTDATGHAHGPDALRAAFETLDEELAGLRARSEWPIYLVLLSDHGIGGGEVLENVYPVVKKHLRSSGFRKRKSLDREGAVVLTPFGLVSSFEAYTRPGAAAAVARSLVSVPGVDLCALPEGAGWAVLDGDGRAVIERRRRARGVEWAYRPEDADPLDYTRVVSELDRASPGDGFHGEEAWFEATHDATYPDALFRLASAFELVQNPASVVCSVADDYLFGSKSASFGARISVGRLHWTHGGLKRDETLGFLMTDFPGWRPHGPVRFDRALEFLAGHLDPTRIGNHR
jgi:hypothetical protein